MFTPDDLGKLLFVSAVVWLILAGIFVYLDKCLGGDDPDPPDPGPLISCLFALFLIGLPVLWLLGLAVLIVWYAYS